MLLLPLVGSMSLVPNIPLHRAAPRVVVTMSDSDELGIPDPKFAQDELSRTWERAGVGKKRWRPGDVTGDSTLDTRLLYSTWVLNPLELYVREGCSQCAAAQLVMGWLELPFAPVTASAQPLPRLAGAGVPAGPNGDGLCTYGEIVSFATAASKEKRVAPATGREDVSAWLGSPSVTSLAPLLHGRQVDDGTPCLNAWGISMDDAMVLPVLKALMDGAAFEAGAESSGEEDELELEARVLVERYMAFNYAKAGMGNRRVP